MKFFITGSNGFLGRHLCSELRLRGIDFIAGERASYGDLVTQEWANSFRNTKVVVHLAARVHVLNENPSDSLNDYMLTNYEATVKIAVAAKSQGVKRFIFISSVKVNGEETYENPFKMSDLPAPSDPYGISKMKAEEALMELHEQGVFEVVIIRPPLVYGPGVKANFRNLFNLVKKKIPLPFGCVKNKRSFISVFNLVDLIILCAEHPQASGQTFLASDDCDLSLKELVIKMGSVLGLKINFLPIPVFLMKFVAVFLGKKAFSQRIFGNLQVDISQTKKILNWKPPHTFESTFVKKDV